MDDAAALVSAAGSPLSPAALALYRALLQAPEDEPRARAARLGWTPEQGDAATAELVDAGLLIASARDEQALRPINPEIGLRRLVAQAEQELRRRQDDIEALRGDVESVVDEFLHMREERLSRQIEILESPDEIVGAIEALTEQARHEICSMMLGAPSLAQTEEARPREEDVLDRGVGARVIYLEAHATKGFAKDVEWFAERGTHIRLAPTLPLQMLLYDDFAVLTAIDPEQPGAGAAVVRAPGIVAGMRALFEMQWAAAREPGITPAQSPDADPLTSIERTLLRLLAQGQKDDAVARALGISVRTTRRIVADLSERAGATSRFELAVKAGRLGWL